MKFTNQSEQEIKVKIVTMVTGDTDELTVPGIRSDDNERNKRCSPDFTYEVIAEALAQTATTVQNISSNAHVKLSIRSGSVSIAVSTPTEA